MDRKNGGDPLAPPRPPKLLPRVQRPRAPEPTTMNETTATQTTPVHLIERAPQTATAATQIGTGLATVTAQRLSTGANNNLNLNQQLQLPLAQPERHSISSTTALTALAHSGHSGSNHSNSVIAGGNVSVIGTLQPDFEDYQIHHLTFLPQRPSSLSRNSSHLSSTSSSSSITAANSFARRRPPPPPTGTPGAAVPLLTITGTGGGGGGGGGSSAGSGSSSVGIHFLSHFHSAEPVPASPVTLAQPRPESERLTNEYVDTPLRTAQQLQHASRAQHPAGQNDDGQTTTHHLLLLPQRELRLQHQQHQQQHQQHQQHQQQQQQHSNRLAGAAGSAPALSGTDGTDGFLHSHHSNHKSSSSPSASASSSSMSGATTASSMCPHKGKAALQSQSQPPTSSFAGAHHQPITQPITKQPASSTAAAAITAAAAASKGGGGGGGAGNTCKFVKDLPALDELLDLHNIATGIQTPQGMVSAVNGASPLGTPIIIGGEPVSLNTITCPRCDRCRCEQCQSPRPLPQTWVCNKTCLCSAESVIDYASCLCCAKALFYHCARDNDCDDGSGTPCVDNPCSCGPYKRTQRWGWLGALSIVLPCLWCYWPMRGCISLCEKCYGRYAGRGCRCQQIGSTSSMLPIVPLSVNGGSMLGGTSGGGGGIGGGGVGGGGQNVGGAGQQGGTKSVGGKVANHHHYHSECSAASRILRKGDLTPEKRLLDSSPEY